MTCSKCGKPLTGGADTFGPIDTPLCLFCHFEALAKPKEPVVTYGIKVDEETGAMIYTIKINREDEDRES